MQLQQPELGLGQCRVWVSGSSTRIAYFVSEA